MFRDIDDQVCYAFYTRLDDVFRATERYREHTIGYLERLLLRGWNVGQVQLTGQSDGETGVLAKSQTRASYNEEVRLPSCWNGSLLEVRCTRALRQP